MLLAPGATAGKTEVLRLITPSTAISIEKMVNKV